jgi:hypothetical protein
MRHGAFYSFIVRPIPSKTHATAFAAEPAGIGTGMAEKISGPAEPAGDLRRLPTTCGYHGGVAA